MPSIPTNRHQHSADCCCCSNCCCFPSSTNNSTNYPAEIDIYFRRAELPDHSRIGAKLAKRSSSSSDFFFGTTAKPKAISAQNRDGKSREKRWHSSDVRAPLARLSDEELELSIKSDVRATRSSSSSADEREAIGGPKTAQSHGKKRMRQNKRRSNDNELSRGTGGKTHATTTTTASFQIRMSDDEQRQIVSIRELSSSSTAAAEGRQLQKNGMEKRAQNDAEMGDNGKTLAESAKSDNESVDKATKSAKREDDKRRKLPARIAKFGSHCAASLSASLPSSPSSILKRHSQQQLKMPPNFARPSSEAPSAAVREANACWAGERADWLLQRQEAYQRAEQRATEAAQRRWAEEMKHQREELARKNCAALQGLLSSYADGEDEAAYAGSQQTLHGQGWHGNAENQRLHALADEAHSNDSHRPIILKVPKSNSASDLTSSEQIFEGTTREEMENLRKIMRGEMPGEKGGKKSENGQKEQNEKQ